MGNNNTHVTDYNDVITVSRYLESMKYLGETFGISENDQESLRMYSDVFDSILNLKENGLKVVLYRINQDLHTKINATDDEMKKYVLYSGHYQTIWALLSQMGLTSLACIKSQAEQNKPDPACLGKPVFSSSLVFKVFVKNVGETDKFVRVIYNGTDVTEKLSCFKDSFCSLNDFQTNYINTSLFASEDDYDKTCQNYDVHLQSKLIALSVACLIFGLIMLFVFIKLLRQKYKKD